MAAKGYTSALAIANFLGVTFTGGQITQAGVLIEQAEAMINGVTGRAFMMAAQTDEAFYYPRALVYLAYAPVTSVTAITGRAVWTETDAALTLGTDYEVRSLTDGLIWLAEPDSWQRILVDYTPVATCPADISLACTEIVANWMQASLQPGSFGLDSYSLPDLTVKFARSHAQSALPPNAAAILERYRYRSYA